MGRALRPAVAASRSTSTKTESGTRSRFNLTWHITPDIMAYYTFSQGYRPGGFNRTILDDCRSGLTFRRGTLLHLPGRSQDLHRQQRPVREARGLAGGQSDQQRGRLQDRVLRPSTDGQRVGVLHELEEPAVVAVRSDHPRQHHLQRQRARLRSSRASRFSSSRASPTGSTVQGSSSVNSSSQSNSPCLESVGVDPDNKKTANNPTPAGQCVAINSVAGALPNALGAFGAPPPFSPPWMFNLRARYDWKSG